MSEHTSIGWTDSTFNPWRGCTKVSEGCKHCYAETLVTTRLKGKWGKGQPRTLASDKLWNDPVKWNKQPWLCDACGMEHAVYGQICLTTGCDCETRHRRRVFCASLADWLDDEVPTEWLVRLLDLIHATPNLTWQLVTKRPELWHAHMDTIRRLTWPKCREWVDRWYNGEPPANVWLICSAENQAMLDQRAQVFFKIPAAVHAFSIEPLLGPVDLTRVDWINMHGGHQKTNILSENISEEARQNYPALKDLHPVTAKWIIVGGESGRYRRDCGLDAIQSVIQQCVEYKVPVFVKQDVGRFSGMQGRIPDNLWALKQFP